MAKKMKIITIVLSVVCLALFIANLYLKNAILTTLTITVFTILYHFAMRLFIGYVFDDLLKNQVDYTASWFQEKPFEKKLYNFLKINKLKKNAPTFQPSTFDFKNKTLKQIIMATCQAEIVHEVIIIFSFIPLTFAMIFGEFWIFLVTSIVSAVIDLFFVFIQRYNRPRLLKLLEKSQQTNKK